MPLTSWVFPYVISHHSASVTFLVLPVLDPNAPTLIGISLVFSPPAGGFGGAIITLPVSGFTLPSYFLSHNPLEARPR